MQTHTQSTLPFTLTHTLTRGGHLSEDEEEEGGGVDLQMSPLGVPDDSGTGPGVVLGVDTVQRALGVLELLHLVQLEGRRGERGQKR